MNIIGTNFIWSKKTKYNLKFKFAWLQFSFIVREPNNVCQKLQNTTKINEIQPVGCCLVYLGFARFTQWLFACWSTYTRIYVCIHIRVGQSTIMTCLKISPVGVFLNFRPRLYGRLSIGNSPISNFSQSHQKHDTVRTSKSKPYPAIQAVFCVKLIFKHSAGCSWKHLFKFIPQVL